MTYLMNGEGSRSIVVVIPSITAANIVDAEPWLRQLRRSGVHAVVVANNSTVADLRPTVSSDMVDFGRNAGFASSVNRVALQFTGWDWLVMLNDDLQPSADTIRELTNFLSSEDTAHGEGLVLFDPELSAPIPNSLRVFLNLSLLEGVGTRLRSRQLGRLARERHAKPHTETLMKGHYKSFSAVAIGRDAWKLVGRLDEAMPFCYEDADFTSRYVEATGRQPTCFPLPINHRHSSSTKSHIAQVLPVVVYSSYQYLNKLGRGKSSAKLLIVVALILRLPLSLLSNAPRKDHVRGILIAMRYLLRNERPALPPYQDFLAEQ